MIRCKNPSYPHALSSNEISRIREIVGAFLSKHPSKYLSDAEVEAEIKSRMNSKADPRKIQQAINFAIENYHYEIKRYEGEGGKRRTNPPMLVLGNPPRKENSWRYDHKDYPYPGAAVFIDRGLLARVEPLKSGGFSASVHTEDSSGDRLDRYLGNFSTREEGMKAVESYISGRQKNPPSDREPFPYSSPHGFGSWAPFQPLKKPDVKSLRPRFDASSPTWQKHRARVTPTLAAYLMPLLKTLGVAAVYDPSDESVTIHRGFSAGQHGKFNTGEEEISWVFAKANADLNWSRQYEPKKVSERSFEYGREPVRVNRGGSMRGRNPKVQPPGSPKRFWPRLPPMPSDDDAEGDIGLAKKTGWFPVWTEDQEMETDRDGKPIPIDPTEMRKVVRKLDEAGQYYDIDDDGNIWVYVAPQKDSTGGAHSWKKRMNDIYHALGQPIRYPEEEPGGSQTRGRMMNPFAADSGFLNTLYVVTEEDIEEWRDQPRFPFREAIGWENQQRQGHDIERPKYKGWNFVEEHFVDSSGFGQRGEAALTIGEFVDKLVAGHGYILTGIGQFQVKVSEYRRASSSKRKRNPLDRCEREFLRGHVAAHKEDAGRSRSQFLRGEIAAHKQDIDRFSNPLGGRGDASEDDVRELELYIDNDEQLYNSRFIPIVKNLLKKMRKGTYNHELSVKLWMYFVDEAAKRYIAEYGSEGGYVFTKATRLQVAKNYAAGFKESASQGEYDYLIVEPKRPGTKVHASAFPLDDFYTDLGMHEKDYRYKVVPRSGSFEPLYAKDTMQVAEIMRMYSEELFDVFDMKEKRKENRGRRGR